MGTQAQPTGRILRLPKHRSQALQESPQSDEQGDLGGAALDRSRPSVAPFSASLILDQEVAMDWDDNGSSDISDFSPELSKSEESDLEDLDRLSEIIRDRVR